MTLPAFLAPPYTIPTWKEIAVVILVVALGRGWYDERQKYNDVVEIAQQVSGTAEECKVVTGARLQMLTERVEIAEARHAVLRAWLEANRVMVPRDLLADAGD